MDKQIFLKICMLFGLSVGGLYAGDIDALKNLKNACLSLQSREADIKCDKKQVKCAAARHMTRIGKVLTLAEAGDLEYKTEQDYWALINDQLAAETEDVKKDVKDILQYRNDLIDSNKAQKAYEALVDFTAAKSSQTTAKRIVNDLFVWLQKPEQKEIAAQPKRWLCHNIGRLYARSLQGAAAGITVFAAYKKHVEPFLKTLPPLPSENN